MARNSKIGFSSTLLFHLASVITVAVWGLSFVSTKVLLANHLGPVEIYLYRFIMAYIIVWAFSHNRLWAANWRDEGLFMLVGLTGGSLYFIAENIALEFTTTTNVSLLTSTSPLLCTVLVGLLYKSERPGWQVLLGSMVAILGVGCTIFNTTFNTGGLAIEVNPKGDILAVVAALCWAFYALLLKPLNANYDVWFISRKSFFYGIITSLPFLAMQESTLPIAEVFTSGPIIANLLFLGLMASCLAYVLWTYAIKGLGPLRASNYLYFQPVVTLIAAVFILGEPITVVGAIGIVLILLGVWLSDWLKRR